ncbi:MAG: hypothetical protein R2705_18930 [Ilumatobacteraceae bacterium]
MFVEPVDAVVSRLLGRPVATQNSAFGSMAIDNRVHGSTSYDDEMLERAGLTTAMLPTLVPMDAPVGGLCAAAAEHLGIPAGTPLLPGTLDSITSAVGTGAVSPDVISLVIGTTSVIVSHVPERSADLDHAIGAVPSPVDGSYFVMAENGVGGKALDVALRQWFLAEDTLSDVPFPADAFERAERLAGSAPAGANGTMFFPWLAGSISPAPNDDVRGGFTNLGLTTTAPTSCAPSTKAWPSMPSGCSARSSSSPAARATSFGSAAAPLGPRSGPTSWHR